MLKIFTQTPRVVVIQETCADAGRKKMDGILKYAKLYGPWFLHSIQNRVGEQRLDHFGDWGASGAIVGQSMLGMESALQHSGLPIVMMDPDHQYLDPGSAFAGYDRIENDGTAVGISAAEFFLTKGFTHFAYIGEALNRPWSIRRGQGFGDRLATDGFVCHHYPVSRDTGSMDWAEEQTRLADWLRELPRPIALFAAMDIRARQVLDTCLINKIQVPAEMAILGVDDDEQLCLGSYPSLSSVECDMTQCGFMAAQLLDEHMRGRRRGKEVLTYGVKKIVERESTHAVQPLPDQLVARAMEFIRLNAYEGIDVHHVVAYLKVSRRLVEMRVRQSCGCSILDAIQSVKLERVRRLLVETDLSIREITDRSGYQTEDHLRRLFKRRFGMSMREFRKEFIFLVKDGGKK